MQKEGALYPNQGRIVYILVYLGRNGREEYKYTNKNDR